MTLVQRLMWLFSTLFMIVLNTLAVILPLNGSSTKVLSDLYSTLITPAGFTFSIWSIIYLGLIIIVILVLLGKLQFSKSVLKRYVVSCLANGLWIVAWHYQNLHLAMVLMLCLLFSLIMIDRGMKTVSASIRLYPFVRSAFLLYLGWIVVASLLMTLIYAKYQLAIIGGFEKEVAMLALIIVAVLSILVLQKEKNAMTTLVALWASYGIQQNTMSYGVGDRIRGLSTVLLIVLSICLLIFLIKNQVRR